jgi:hypothetical protein
MRGSSSGWLRVLGILLLIVGSAALVVGVIYLGVPASKLPSFIPGHIAGVTRHHTKRGITSVGLGIVLIIFGVAALLVRSRPAHQ